MSNLHDSSRFDWVGLRQLARVGWQLCWLGALTLGCDDARELQICDSTDTCTDDTYDSLFESDELSESSCDTLDEDECRAAGHCILDMRCAPQSSCAGPNCDRECDIIEACVPY